MSETIYTTEAMQFSPDLLSGQEISANVDNETDVLEETRGATRYLAEYMGLHSDHAQALEQWVVDDHVSGGDVFEGVLDIINPLVRDKLEGRIHTQEEKIYGASHAMLDQLLGYRLIERCELQETLHALQTEFGDDVSELEVMCLQQEGMRVLSKAAEKRRQVGNLIAWRVQSVHKKTDAQPPEEEPRSTDASQVNAVEERSEADDTLDFPGLDSQEDVPADTDGTQTAETASRKPTVGVTPREDTRTGTNRYRNGVIKSQGLRAKELSRETADTETANISNGDRLHSTSQWLLDGANSMEWADYAVCRNAEPETFFPEMGGSTREAKRICAMCGVVQQCLQFALANNEQFGVWGGLSEPERRKIRHMQG